MGTSSPYAEVREYLEIVSMAPNAHVVEASSQQVLAQAAQQLLEAVRQNDGAKPSPFAVALLDLMEHSSKLQEYDQMLSVAQQTAESEEAKTWQQVSLMTLQYCQKGLVEQQQRALTTILQLTHEGDSLFLAKDKIEAPREAASDAALEAPEKDIVSEFVPPSAPPPAPSAAPLKPPGVWVTRPPPGLEGPPGLVSPPGPTTMVEVKKKPLAPWRKAAVEDMNKVQQVAMLGINFDAFSEDSDN